MTMTVFRYSKLLYDHKYLSDEQLERTMQYKVGVNFISTNYCRKFQTWAIIRNMNCNMSDMKCNMNDAIS
uniref:Uncharacterized protein n=1 Tax=Romanomermis culicivorax TaxID=13658 RepID=A0A915I2I7_ROMCU